MEKIGNDMTFKVNFRDFILFWIRPSIYSNFKTRMYHRVSSLSIVANFSGQALNPEENRCEIHDQIPHGAGEIKTPSFRLGLVRII